MPLIFHNRHKTIPELRTDILEIAEDPRLPADIARRLRRIERQMYRRPAIRKTAVRSAPMTPQKAFEIRETFYSNPDMSMQRIGDLCGVNMGRVSENVAGFRASR